MRRRRGAGTVYKRKDGRFEASLHVRTSLGRERVSQYASTRVEAEELLVQMRVNDRNGLINSTTGWKLGDYMDDWLSVAKTSVRKSTYTSYEATVRIYLKPGLGNKFLTRLTVADVQSFLDNHKKAGKSPRNLEKMRVVLSSILERALTAEIVSRNVARLTKIPSYKPKEVTPWSITQVSIFLNASKDNRFYPIYLIMSFYGLRVGEALGLSWSDIDIENNVIHIRKQIQYDNLKYSYVDVKTRAGRRDLPLTNIVKDALSVINKTYAGPLPDLIFKTTGNLPIDYGIVRKTMQRISKDVGLPTITLHHLRHTSATILMSLGISPKNAQSILGHAHISTTLQIYQHSDIEGKSAAFGQYEQKLVEMSTSSRQLQPSNEKAIV